jgi:ribosome biogenesis GTPase A
MTKINWFPGHMNKARRELAVAMRQIDVVIEMLDARLPYSSQNPMLAKLRGERPCLRLLGKADLADPVMTRAWVEAFREEDGVRVLPFVATERADLAKVPDLCRKLAPQRRDQGKTVRVIVVGIPNAGKSTLINGLIGRRSAKVGDRPAVTRGQQRFHVDEFLSISDTPGVLWPRLDDQAGALKLAASGAIRETAFEPIDVAEFALELLADRYGELLMARYKVDALPQGGPALLEMVGRRRGLLGRGGVIDLERAAEVVLRELQRGEIGRITFEGPEDRPRSQGPDEETSGDDTGD